MCCVINLTKGLYLREKSLVEMFCCFFSFLLVLVFSKEFIGMSTILASVKYPKIQIKSGISKDKEEEQRKADLKRIKSGMGCYEAIQFTQLS